MINKLDGLSRQLSESSPQSDVSNLLVDLNLAENEFQQASVTGNTAELDKYKQEMNGIFNKMALIIDHYHSDNGLPTSRKQIAQALQQKLAVSQKLFDLKRGLDSLLKYTTSSTLSANPSVTQYQNVTIQYGRKPGKPDTVVSTKLERSKNGLLRRLKDALNNKNPVKVVTIHHRANAFKTIHYSRKIVKPSKPISPADLLKMAGHQYALIAHSKQELILANLTLLTELRQVIQELQDIDHVAYEKSRDETLQQYQLATNDLNTYTSIASAAVVIFIILLIVYMRKATAAENMYRKENERAVQLAAQKTDILAIMSHEIRNKLMAINSAIFLLKKTPVLPEQEKKIASINLSSELILGAVNNVLDTDKLERRSVEINKKSAFSPLKAITESIDTLYFMAESKEIALNIRFGWQEDQFVLGDAFRLKQILINLLSNAIKYTDKGYVNVSSELTEKDNQVWLNVEVKDSGQGIPKSQQAKLFTRYYQTDAQKHGSGLGLYLCRQLVELQGGNIKLESEEGQGCTICFSIPYELVEEDVLVRDSQSKDSSLPLM
jgi:signal transduction histidine kinase